MNRFLILLLISAYCNGDVLELKEEMGELKTRLVKVEKMSLRLDAQLNEPSRKKIAAEGCFAIIASSYCVYTVVESVANRDLTIFIKSLILVGIAFWSGKSAYNDYQKKMDYRKLFDKST